MKNDVIKPSNSPYNSLIWVVPKKPDSQENKRWRMIIDFRVLNEKTIGDTHLLPNITETLDPLGSAKYCSVFDLASGFHQIPMHEKMTFSTPHGHYQLNRSPFGLKNAPTTFQRFMDQILSELQRICSFILTTLLFMRLSWPNIRQNSISSPNDYERRILSYNQTNVSFCEKK